MYFLLNIFNEAKQAEDSGDIDREIEEREREEQLKKKSNIFIKWGRFLNVLFTMSAEGVKSNL